MSAETLRVAPEKTPGCVVRTRSTNRTSCERQIFDNLVSVTPYYQEMYKIEQYAHAVGYDIEIKFVRKSTTNQVRSCEERTTI